MKNSFLLFLGFILLAVAFFSHVGQSYGQTHFASHSAVCQKEEGQNARCHAQVVTDSKGAPITQITPSGYTPQQLQSAYDLPSTSGQTIAIVDAYDDPYAYNDLTTYSNTFGLSHLASCPVANGTTSSPCFQKVSQNGTTSYPRANSGWGLEISLDVQIAHATCPQCNILLVEARSANYSDLLAAVDRARLMGAKIVSNSYGSSEFSSESSYDGHFNFPGVMFLFSAGDSGYGASYPAASPFVTAVGGTSLFLNPDNSYQSESAWSGTGSGCSAYETKPSWQHDTLCGNRTIADVSADADPNTGVAVYDSLGYNGKKGWFQVGGTSLSTPLIAGVYALSGNIPAATIGASLPYSFGTVANLNDILTGSNGSCGTYLCTALSGYDGPTGLGTPKGTTAF